MGNTSRLLDSSLWYRKGKMVGDRGGIGGKKVGGGFDQNTLHTCMEFSNTKIKTRQIKVICYFVNLNTSLLEASRIENRRFGRPGLWTQRKDLLVVKHPTCVMVRHLWGSQLYLCSMFIMITLSWREVEGQSSQCRQADIRWSLSESLGTAVSSKAFYNYSSLKGRSWGKGM